MSVKNFILKVFVVVVISLGAMAFIIPESRERLQPDYIPPELAVTPYGQTVSSSPWRAVWDLYISGGQGSYCIRVDWGDSFPDWVTCGYLPGRHYQFVHDFNYPGNGPGTYYQTWKASGVGGPVYDYTYVIKR